ncbi:hypothetical protein HanPI659440_Chr03g0111571 [Helianthus annuus]|nr:hypothetical protein HanPI659440_Chr03g0111571 [Helianthus annuus]
MFLVQGIKVIDTPVESFATGAWQALGNAWKGCSRFVQKSPRLLRRLQIASLTCKSILKILNLLRSVIQKLLIKIKKVKMKMIRSGRLFLKDSRKLARTHFLAMQVLNGGLLYQSFM